jgi:GxxExxY protein
MDESLMHNIPKQYPPLPLETEKIAKSTIDAAFRVHTKLGPGLLESAYEACLAYELRRINLDVQTQVALPVIYDEIQIDTGYRIDMLIEKAVVVEVKAVDQMIPLYQAQVLTYIKLSGYRLGLLINFNVPRLRDGIQRLVR